MCGMMKEGIKEPGRGGCTVGSDEEWECSGERRDTENLFSAHNRSYTKKAVGPCSTEDRTHEHEQHNEMVCFLHTNKTYTLQTGLKVCAQNHRQ